jgi:pyruvate dehydrogenase E1 component
MVAKANGEYGELGGHIASYARAADLFEVGFNHFFRGRKTVGDKTQFEDLVFFQAHSAPGIYARAFLEGRLNTDNLAHYRQEITAKNNGSQGLSSYPHPFLMPDFWQFPTGSMGIGPISSIYHARFMRYLTDRQLVDCSTRKVWGVFGDGEMDEPESMSALTLASREKLDNLIWVVNCNLQRLDGPVRGNGQIINELEKLFRGSGWNVIKLLWGSDWDGLFARDTTGALDRAFAQTVDGQMQTFAAKDGRFNRENFFGQLFILLFYRLYFPRREVGAPTGASELIRVLIDLRAYHKRLPAFGNLLSDKCIGFLPNEDIGHLVFGIKKKQSLLLLRLHTNL